jgi:hypothetical protein
VVWFGATCLGVRKSLTVSATAKSNSVAAALTATLSLPCADRLRLCAGALTHLGISCTVEGDARGLPSCECTF